MRYLGIDYGTKNIGIALSEEEGRMAFPYGIVSNDAKAFSRLRNICLKEGVEKIVLGLPRSLEGKETAMTEKVRNFAVRLYEETGREVLFWDEVLSTQEAGRLQEKNKKIDASAAAIVLNNFLQNN